MNNKPEILPDSNITISEMKNLYGYDKDDMLPLTQFRALELYDKDMSIYLLHKDNTESLVFDISQIQNHSGIFGIEREEWEKSAEYISQTNHFEIYQLRDGDDLHYHRFASLRELEAGNLAVDRGNYNLVYTAPLPPTETLEGIYQRFNIDHPKDFIGHSLSVSDIVVIQRDGEKSAHYVDSFGFVELPDFLDINNKGVSPMSNIESAEPNKIMEKSVYKETLVYAREHGEIDKYNESRNLNINCKNAINDAINETRHDTHFYNMKDAVKNVVDVYGSERVELLMAKIVQGAEWDERYSHQNREWAKSFDIPHGMKDVYSSTHPCLLDGFLDRLREKPSILDTLKVNAEKSRLQEKKDTNKNNKMEL